MFFGSTATSLHAQPIGRLALRLQEILDAVLGHDARGLLRESAA